MTHHDAALAIPKPHITARGAGTAAGCWVLYALFYASLIARTEAAPFAGALIGQLMSAAVLALLSVPVWLLVVRRMDQVGWGWKVGLHLLVAPLYAFLGLEGFLLLVRWGAGPAVAAQIGARYAWIFFSHVVLYALQFALYHAVRTVQRLRQQEQQAAELAALARERELAALKAQINPHFLFNTLNSVSAAAGRDPDAARAMLEQLASLLRYAMGRSVHAPSEDGTALVSLEDELDFARRYLALESHRFGDRLAVCFDIDDEALGAPLPPMTLQPLVENAVRHGIAPLEEGGTITVRATCRDEHVHVVVEDTGAGPGEALPENGALPPGGTGLQNTSARLERHFGPAARLHAEENPPRGFRIWFSVPAARASWVEEARPDSARSIGASTAG